MSSLYNTSEDYVNKMYQSIGIYQPHQIDLEVIASRLKTEVLLLPSDPLRLDNLIILDSRTSKAQQWQDFGHELCHVLWALGNQIDMPIPWEVYQESKANNFAQYACIPPFMLQQMALPIHERDGILLLQETFNVEWEFAEKRLQQHLRNIFCR